MTQICTGDELRAPSAGLRDEVLGLLPPIKVASAFLGGSLIEGFGNHTSDLDLLALLYAPPTSDDLAATRHDYVVTVGPRTIVVSSAGGRRSDTELWTLDYHRRWSSKLATADMTSGPHIIDPPLAWIEFVTDLRIGVPIVGDELVEELRAKFPWTQLAKFLMIRNEHLANTHIEDAAGALSAGDAGTAMLSSRDALAHAVDAYLAGAGETNCKPKWRTRKLARTAEADLFDLYLDAELDTSREAGDLLASARRRILAAQDFLIRAHRAIVDRSDAEMRIATNVLAVPPSWQVVNAPG